MMLVMAYFGIGAVRADAVFVSRLQRSDEPSVGQVRHAVAAAIRAFGSSGCAGRVTQEFGDHPETAGADAGGRLVIRPRPPAEHASSSVSGAVT